MRPTIGPWQSSCHWNRHQEVVLARLRIGHTRLTHGYIMARETLTDCTRFRVRLSIPDIPLPYRALCWFFFALSYLRPS